MRAREWSREEKQWITDNLSYVPETGDLIWKGCASSVNNKIRAAGSVAGTLSNGYLNIANYSVKGDRHNYRAHRIVWFLNYGEVPSMLDHINGNRVDNRIENLRPTTNALNLKNQKPSDYYSFVRVKNDLSSAWILGFYEKLLYFKDE